SSDLRCPLSHAVAPAAAAALARVHFSLASSLGATSIWRIHRRVTTSRCEPPTDRPARTSRVPAPASAAPAISGPGRSSGKLLPLLFCVLVDMAPSRTLVIDRYCRRREPAGHQLFRVIAPRGACRTGACTRGAVVNA